jgi:hypothetical protein
MAKAQPAGIVESRPEGAGEAAGRLAVAELQQFRCGQGRERRASLAPKGRPSPAQANGLGQARNQINVCALKGRATMMSPEGAIHPSSGQSPANQGPVTASSPEGAGESLRQEIDMSRTPALRPQTIIGRGGCSQHLRLATVHEWLNSSLPTQLCLLDPFQEVLRHSVARSSSWHHARRLRP